MGAGQVDEYWNNLVLGMIGASIEPTHMITGLRLVDKMFAQRGVPSLRIEVWYTNEDQSQVQVLKRSVENCMTTKADGSAANLAVKCEVKSHQSK